MHCVRNHALQPMFAVVRSTGGIMGRLMMVSVSVHVSSVLALNHDWIRLFVHYYLVSIRMSRLN